MAIVRKVFSLFGVGELADKLFKRWVSGKEHILYSVVYPVVLKIPFAQNLYFLFSKSLAHELKMFLGARREYLKTKYQGKENLFLLRRNIHRIEKGLLMKNRRHIFALDYIEDTVNMLKAVVANKHNNNQVKWAFDILREYFNVTDSAPQINRARIVFDYIKL